SFSVRTQRHVEVALHPSDQEVSVPSAHPKARVPILLDVDETRELVADQRIVAADRVVPDALQTQPVLDKAEVRTPARRGEMVDRTNPGSIAGSLERLRLRRLGQPRRQELLALVEVRDEGAVRASGPARFREDGLDRLVGEG